ncbi:MAG: hypothetical protein R3B81_19630 [bacterium]
MAKAKKTSKPESGSRAAQPAAGAISSDRSVIRIRWERRNIVTLLAGLAAVVLGYVLLSQGSVTAAPILLVGGYCVLIPLAFMI